MNIYIVNIQNSTNTQNHWHPKSEVNMSTTTYPLCPPKDSYPSVKEFRLGLGEGSAIAVYTFSAGVLVFNIVLLIILIIRFIKTVPSRQVWISKNTPFKGYEKISLICECFELKCILGIRFMRDFVRFP